MIKPINLKDIVIKRENIESVYYSEGDRAVTIPKEAIIHNLIDGDYRTEFTAKEIEEAVLRHIENCKNSWYKGA